MRLEESWGLLGMKSNWKEIRLGDVAEIKGGKRLPKGKQLSSIPNNHPYIKVKNMGQQKVLQLNSEYEYVDDETQKSISRYIVSAGDILISVVGTVGLVSIVGETLNNANQTENCDKITNLREIDADYLYYYLISPLGQEEIHKGTVGAVQAKLPLKNIQDFSIICPDLIEQKKIASVLSIIDEKIACNERINDNLLQQAGAVFNKFYKESPNQQPFTSLVSVLGGGTPKTGNPDFWDGPIPFFTPKDVGTPYTFQTEKYITESGLTHCNSHLYQKDTTFVTARGTVGKVSLAGTPMAMNQSCYALASETVDPLLVYFYVLKAVASLKHKASGAVFDAIVTRDFDSETINILSDDDSKKVLSLIKPMMDTIHNNSQENMRLAALRDSLLPKLMSGELDVSNLDI